MTARASAQPDLASVLAWTRGGGKIPTAPAQASPQARQGAPEVARATAAPCVATLTENDREMFAPHPRPTRSTGVGAHRTSLRQRRAGAIWHRGLRIEEHGRDRVSILHPRSGHARHSKAAPGQSRDGRRQAQRKVHRALWRLATSVLSAGHTGKVRPGGNAHRAGGGGEIRARSHRVV